MSELLCLSDCPSESEIDGWHAVMAAAHARDLPAVPGPGRVETAGVLCVTEGDSRYVRLAVPAEGGAYAGVVSLRLFDGEENRRTAWVEHLAVRPELRNRGIGTRLWQEVRAILEREQRTAVGIQVEIGGAGEKFALAHGFGCAIPLVMYVQDVAGEEAEEPALPEGYRFVEWDGAVPDEFAVPFAAVRDAMSDSPWGDFEEERPRWDAARSRAFQQLVVDRGGEMLTVVAVAPDGSFAGYTELVRRSPDGSRAIQYGTAVAAAHRGLGLGRAVKLRMLRLVGEGRMPVREIVTGVSDDNGPMRAVNKLLGYRPERSVGVFQARL
ncbi:GNAT family N-acetyltransferase [Streptomyces hesseae]|uniref:GNAT family N-acetyltransferase n=1 Tax=Streptomyces hesseae TaxID=3075519 RepID=A0ABU2SU27_9ACTN|nr:GNAT family N-acetyltransferase [Streptomyces sp. DSM 40473]MDT0452517.1 GNAT family N-acetyltransferase [Streptomyces sp. DSM 40473]